MSLFERQPLLARAPPSTPGTDAESQTKDVAGSWPKRGASGGAFSLRARAVLVGLGAATVLLLLFFKGPVDKFEASVRAKAALKSANATAPDGPSLQHQQQQQQNLVRHGKLLGAEAEPWQAPTPLSRTSCIDASRPVLSGMDVVSYFGLESGGQPTRGTDEYSSFYEGFIFMFASEENRSAFMVEPEKYVPKWGSFCAWGMAFEQSIWGKDGVGLGPPNDPEAWYIGKDGRLYIFKSQSVIEAFKALEDEAVARGDEFWATTTENCVSCYNTHCACNNDVTPNKCMCPPSLHPCGASAVVEASASAAVLDALEGA